MLSEQQILALSKGWGHNPELGGVKRALESKGKYKVSNSGYYHFPDICKVLQKKYGLFFFFLMRMMCLDSFLAY